LAYPAPLTYARAETAIRNVRLGIWDIGSIPHE